MDTADQSEGAADQTVCDIRLVRDKGGEDQKDDDRNEGRTRKDILDTAVLLRLHRLIQLPEEKEHDGHREKSAQLHGKEDSGTALHEKKVQKIHLCEISQHNTGSIPHQCRRPLQIRGHRDGKHHRKRRDLQLFADHKRHRGYHQYRRHIVDEGRYRAGKKRHEDDDMADILASVQNQIREKVWHSGLDKKIDDDHGSGDHQKHIPVDRGNDCGERKNSAEEIEKRRCQNGMDPVLLFQDNNRIHQYKKN